ncbi:hypothetical protein [Glycomyces sp. NRRL B-16210]|uniref:hypothetical protein n=1 Tax=Glycomyces sp. NRRL B-16210 TaxID=1463821 RepID=UPI000ACEE2FD|nr:hypothetical protein [Glycomyces sp. NRRL B-16210]
MFEDALDGLITWLNTRIGVLQVVLANTLKENEWVLLSEDFTNWGLNLRLHFSAIVYASYGILIVVGGLILMSHETLQTRYSIKELTPRLVVGFLLAGMSFFIVIQAFEINNDIASAFRESDLKHRQDGSTDSIALGELDRHQFMDYEPASIDELLLELLWIVLTVICLIMLFLLSLMRDLVWFFLAALSPIALACHALPMTEWAARLWWRMLGACMASSIGQAALIWVWNSLVWPYGQGGVGRHFGYVGHIAIHSLYMVVIVWMMWQVHHHAFRMANGRPLRIPGSRFLTGVATALAIGAVTGRFRKRRGRAGSGDGQGRPDETTGERDTEEESWWAQPSGRASQVSDMGSAFGHRANTTSTPRDQSESSPWPQPHGEPPARPARRDEGAIDTMFEPQHPLDFSRNLDGFATDAGRRQGIEARLEEAEGQALEKERARQFLARKAGVPERPGRRIADVPLHPAAMHRPAGSQFYYQNPDRVQAELEHGPTPEQRLWDAAVEAVGERELRGDDRWAEDPVTVEVVQGSTPEQEIWDTAARRAAVMEDLRAREAAELRRHQTGETS